MNGLNTAALYKRYTDQERCAAPFLKLKPQETIDMIALVRQSRLDNQIQFAAYQKFHPMACIIPTATSGEFRFREISGALETPA